MAVPKKKRYRQIVRSRRSFRKIKLLKKQNLFKSYFSNFNNRKCAISIPVRNQYRFNIDKGLKIFVRELKGPFFCVNNCPVCHATLRRGSPRKIGLFCYTQLYKRIKPGQWINLDAPFAWFHGIASSQLCKSYWYSYAFENPLWPKKETYKAAYDYNWRDPIWRMTDKQWDLQHFFDRMDFLGYKMWGMLERERERRQEIWLKSYDIYTIWDNFKWRIKKFLWRKEFFELAKNPFFGKHKPDFKVKTIEEALNTKEKYKLDPKNVIYKRPKQSRRLKHRIGSIEIGETLDETHYMWPHFRKYFKKPREGKVANKHIKNSENGYDVNTVENNSN